MKIVLLGFMGSGKTTAASVLRKMTDYSLIETDALVLAETDCKSISEIFDRHGEASFRELETAALSKALQQEDVIISCGGGILESSHNRRLFDETTLYGAGNICMVYLDTSFETIEMRLQGDTSRPLFRSRDDAHSLYSKRLSQYQHAADLVIPTDELSPEEVGRLMKQLLFDVPSVGQREEQMRIWMVIGDPVGHSRSPRLHGALFRDMEMKNHQFVSFRVRDIQSFFESFRSNKALQGLAITVPLKERVMPYLDEISESAGIIGAVNTVVKAEGKLCGHNTDWIGIQEPLLKRGALHGKRVAIVGAGGTARAALIAVKDRAEDVTIINRTLNRATSLAAEFQVSAAALTDIESLGEFDTIIQTTSAELFAQGRSLFDSSAFRSEMVVLDAVYVPEWTPFLLSAQKAGAICITGREMFLAQAAAQFQYHHGREVPAALLSGKAENSAFCEAR